MKQLYGYIYIITNDFNDQVYIGQTQFSIQQRFNKHCTDKPRNTDGIDAIIQSMGKKHFKVTEIEKVPISTLNEREKYWINYYDSYFNGYNKTLGGKGDNLYTEQQIISALQDYEMGLSLQEIYNKYGINKSTLHKYRKVNDIPKREITSHEIASSINNLKIATEKRKIPIENITLQIFYPSKKDALIDMIKRGYSQAQDWHNIRAGLDKALSNPNITFLNFEWRYVYE